MPLLSFGPHNSLVSCREASILPQLLSQWEAKPRLTVSNQSGDAPMAGVT